MTHSLGSLEEMTSLLVTLRSLDFIYIFLVTSFQSSKIVSILLLPILFCRYNSTIYMKRSQQKETIFSIFVMVIVVVEAGTN